MERVEELFRRMKHVEPYPEGVVACSGRIWGTAFFPGGSGLWCGGSGTPRMPIGGVLVLGHDFHSQTAFERALSRGSEVNLPGGNPPPTWRNLLQLFETVGLDPEECFFTNAYMGLREEDEVMGKFPGARDAAFVERCRSFLGVQIATVRPRLIFTLGARVPAILAPLSADLAPWRRVRSLQLLDAAGAIVERAEFASASGFSCTVAGLTHPSMFALNVRRRVYGGLKGREAEVQLCRDALRMASDGTGAA